MNLSLKTLMAGVMILGSLVLPAAAVDNMLIDPGFEGPPAGASWGTWGNISFNNFWGPDVHTSLWADWGDNYGGVYQLGIAGQPGTAYQFVLHNTRIESNWDADLYFGLEYYAADDTTKLGETMVLIDTAARIANGQVDGNVFTMQGTSAAGTAIVRPIFRFDNVNPNYEGQSGATAFVFNSFMSPVPGRGEQFLMNAPFDDTDGNGAYGDYWGKWGTVDFGAYFGANGHAALFADTVGNAGGIWQQGILGTPGVRYVFILQDVRIEANWDADLYMVLEFYGSDDYTKLGETKVLLDTAQTGDGLQFWMSAKAVPGTVYVRPAVYFDNVGSSGGTLRNAFIFDATLTHPLPLPADSDDDGDVDLIDYTAFAACLSGPGVTPGGANCLALFDFDDDSDVDLMDFGGFQGVFTGTLD